MAKRTPVWVGSKEIKLQPGYPKKFTTGTSNGWRLQYRGPFTKLVAEEPARGSVVKGYERYYVEEVTIEPDGAGTEGPGTMNVTVASEVTGGTATPEEETTVAVSSGRLEKSAFANPFFDDLTNVQKAEIKKAFDENATTLPALSGADSVAQALGQKLFDKLLDGKTGWVSPAPTCVITTYSYTRPNVGRTGRGTRTTEKPHPSCPDGYEWLTMGDDVSQNGRGGKYMRQRSYEAADQWDPDFYDIPPSDP